MEMGVLVAKVTFEKAQWNRVKGYRIFDEFGAVTFVPESEAKGKIFGAEDIDAAMVKLGEIKDQFEPMKEVGLPTEINFDVDLGGKI